MTAYNHKWEYEENNLKVTVTGNNTIILLSAMIAYVQDLAWKPRLMLTKTHHKTGPTKIRLWHRNEYSTWRKKSGMAAAASSTTSKVVATNTNRHYNKANNYISCR